MTISVPPEGNNAKLLNSYFAPLKVEAQVAVNMTVKISAGSFWSSAGEYIEYVGGNSPVITAPAQDAKWVAITITELGVINVIDGAASTNPVLPTIPSNELILAGIFIGDTATYITSDMVFDLRPLWQTHSDVTTDLSGYYTMLQTDNLLASKADTNGTPDVEFILNRDQTGVTSTDVMITAERGDETNTHIRWFESLNKWQYTNDGIAWSDLGNDVSNLYQKVGGVAGNITVFGTGDTLADSGNTVADFATAAQGATADSALQNVVDDITPQLGGMLDVNGQSIGDGTLSLLTFTEDATAVNNIDLANSATGVGPILSAVGTDTDIDININTKGTGLLKSNGTAVALVGADLTTFDNTTSNFTTDANVAVNHYTKTENDGTAGTAGAKIDKVAADTVGNFAEHDGNGNLQAGTFSSASFATAAQGATADSALQNIVEDVTPQLGGMLDVNGQSIGDGTLSLLTFTEDAVAVNNIDLANSATGVGPTLSAVGTDTDIDININPKGTGTIKSNGTNVALAGDSYTKNESDAVAGNPGAKVDKVSGIVGNIVEFAALDTINDSGIPSANIVVRNPWSVINVAGPTTVQVGDRIIADSTSVSVGITLPVGVMGAEVDIIDGGNNASTNNITISPNGTELINGVNAAIAINTSNGATSLVYTGATAGWVQKY